MSESNVSSRRYSTIVADPPWELSAGPQTFTTLRGSHAPNPKRLSSRSRPLPYPTMTVDEIKALPVSDLSAFGSHLYLWTTSSYLEQAFAVARAWSFRPAQVLTWCKTPRGLGLGGAFVSTTEFVLFCRRGSLKTLSRVDTSWWNWKRPEQGTGPMHSRKPEAFLDLVETISPGPYLELFARRNRFGWDTWGNESLEHVAVSA